MKRSGTNGTVQDFPVPPKEQYVPVSKTPEAPKVVWHVDPAAQVGPREEEARRKAPEGKILYAISAFLTLMVLWGIFRNTHFVVPQVFSSSSDVVNLDQIESEATGFHEVDSDSGIGGRRTAKHLLEEVVHPEQFLAAERVPLRRVFRPHKVWNTNQQQQQQQQQPYYTGRGGRFGLRRGGST